MLSSLLPQVSPYKSIYYTGSCAAQRRHYTTAPGTAYLLPSDEEERQRLTKQHYLLTRTFGGIVLAPITPSSDDWILDSATGTGVWMLELAKTLPESAQLVGIDIEPRLFPNPATLPPNVRFQVESILNLPNEWANRFSFVHQRLLIAALRTTEWPRALKEIFRVLKPGGWVQLLENDDYVAGPMMKILRSVKHKLMASRGLDIWPGVVPKLKGFLEDCGFVDVRITRLPTPTGEWAGQIGRDGRDNMMGVYRGLKTPLMNQGGFNFFGEGDMYDSLLEGVRREMDSTSGAASWFVTICAQKPAEEANEMVQ